MKIVQPFNLLPVANGMNTPIPVEGILGIYYTCFNASYLLRLIISVTLGIFLSQIKCNFRILRHHLLTSYNNILI